MQGAQLMMLVGRLAMFAVGVSVAAIAGLSVGSEPLRGHNCGCDDASCRTAGNVTTYIVAAALFSTALMLAAGMKWPPESTCVALCCAMGLLLAVLSGIAGALAVFSDMSERCGETVQVEVMVRAAPVLTIVSAFAAGVLIAAHGAGLLVVLGFVCYGCYGCLLACAGCIVFEVRGY